ncbi:MAG: hypothetical protein K2H64_04740 [Desulfovibrio sp.]|nr:hypothetical protein [Desulfovibrio sp.]
MLIANRKEFTKGVILLVSFAAMFVLIMSPVFKDPAGAPQTGLEYADNIFNALSKGSSYFIPEVRESTRAVMDKPVNMEVSIGDKSLTRLALAVLEKSGVDAGETATGAISLRGKLGDLFAPAIEVSDLLYHNNGSAVSEMYEENSPTSVALVWWRILSPMVKAFQKKNELDAANAVDLVIRKGIEPGNNFFGIRPIKIMEHIPLVSFLLAFYVIYAIWYGFGIYGVFIGLGLTGAKKSGRGQ